MAKITLAPLVTDIRGKLGGLVFSAWKSGVNYVRSITGVIKNASSVTQATVRANVSRWSKSWRGDLSDAQRAEWDTHALTQPGKGPSDGGVNHLVRGNSGIMTGFNAFILANLWLATADLAAIAVAPLASPAPSQPTGVGVSFAGGTATVTWAEPLGVTVGSKVRIWARVEGIKGHVQIIATALADALTADITSVRSANGNSILFTSLVGKTLHVQLDCVNAEGTKSAGSNLASDVVA